MRLAGAFPTDAVSNALQAVQVLRSCRQPRPNCAVLLLVLALGPCPSSQHPGTTAPESKRFGDPATAGPDLDGDRLKAAIDAEVGHHGAGAGRPQAVELVADDQPSEALVPDVHTAVERLDWVLASAHGSTDCQLEQAPHRAGAGG